MKFFCILIFCFFFGSVNAAGIADAKIYNFGFGVQYDKIKGQLPCNNKKQLSESGSFQILCEHTSPEGGHERVAFNFGHDGLALSAIRNIKLKRASNWNSLTYELTEKLGKADKTGFFRFGGDGVINSICWGKCDEIAEGDGKKAICSDISLCFSILARSYNEDHFIEYIFNDGPARHRENIYSKKWLVKNDLDNKVKNSGNSSASNTSSCNRLYIGKPVKVGVRSRLGDELFYQAVIVGVSVSSGVASAKVTESGAFFGQVAERGCELY